MGINGNQWDTKAFVILDYGFPVLTTGVRALRALRVLQHSEHPDFLNTTRVSEALRVLISAT